MAAGFTIHIDTSKLKGSMDQAVNELPKVMEQSLGDVMDKWKAAAVNIALLDKGTLRRGISVEVDGMTGLIKSVAKERGFDYAYYWHEVRGDVNNPTTSGTVARYLDVAAERNIGTWQSDVKRDIESYISKIGR